MDPSLPLRGLRLAVVDTETTGTDPLTDRIVQIAVAHVTLGEPEVRLAWSTLIDPGVPIPAAATEIHGIADADVAEAPPWAGMIEEFEEAIAGRVLCAYNAPFDFAFVREACMGLGVEAFPGWPWLDALIPVKVVDRFQAGKSLVDAAERRGIRLDAHGAAGDALTTALLYGPMLREGMESSDRRGQRLIPILSTLGGLLSWQREAALSAEADFVAFRRKSGAHARPSCPWHEIEGLPLPPWPDPPPPTHRIDQSGRVVEVAP